MNISFMASSFQSESRRVTSILFALAVPLFCFQATAADEGTNAAPTKLAPVIVTGSMIPTIETITATPVDVFTAADVAKTGANSIPQLIQKMPSISGNASYGDSRGNAGDGSAAVGLRNIPLGTLVLINGRRIAPNQLVGAGNVDLNAIPLAAIDRIEILKDGSSAIYGADALAGVVNIILKKDFNGTRTVCPVMATQRIPMSANKAIRSSPGRPQTKRRS